MSNNSSKETKVTFGGYKIAIIFSIILAALKLDGVLDITWMIVILPILVDIALDIIIYVVVLIITLIMRIRENNHNYSYNNCSYGEAIHWDYKTQNFYDTAGNKVGNDIEEEQE